MPPQLALRFQESSRDRRRCDVALIYSRGGHGSVQWKQANKIRIITVNRQLIAPARVVKRQLSELTRYRISSADMLAWQDRELEFQVSGKKWILGTGKCPVYSVSVGSGCWVNSLSSSQLGFDRAGICFRLWRIHRHP